MQARAVAARVLALGMVFCALALPAHAFVPSSLPVHATSLPSLSRTCTSRPAVTSLRLQTREDGSTEEQVAEAYKVYDKLMQSKNDGRGYWMDSPFQFFDNIKTAIERNFGDKSPLTLGDDTPSNAVDLGTSPFSPLVSAGDTDVESSEEVSGEEEEASFPVEGELEVKSSGKKKGKKKGKKAKAKAKAGDLEDAKKKAAALKAQLEADD